MNEQTASERFLAAWETAGRPRVEKAVYRRSSVDSTFLAPGSVAMWANTEGATIEDTGRFVTLSWDFTSRAFDLSGGTTKLCFDRAEGDA